MLPPFIFRRIKFRYNYTEYLKKLTVLYTAFLALFFIGCSSDGESAKKETGQNIQAEDRLNDPCETQTLEYSGFRQGSVLGWKCNGFLGIRVWRNVYFAVQKLIRNSLQPQPSVLELTSDSGLPRQSASQRLG